MDEAGTVQQYIYISAEQGLHGTVPTALAISADSGYHLPCISLMSVSAVFNVANRRVPFSTVERASKIGH